ncbi:hypothetical protein MMC31_006376 [Peltigera leucophlebia]|nr:hypothetical protein [Peltigera leucophlebia]
MPPPEGLEAPAPSNQLSTYLSPHQYRKPTTIEDLSDIDVLLGLVKESETSESIPDQSEDICIAVFGELAYRSRPVASKPAASRPDVHRSAKPKSIAIAPLRTGPLADGIEVRVPRRSTLVTPNCRYFPSRGRPKRKNRGRKRLFSEKIQSGRATPRSSKTKPALNEAVSARPVRPKAGVPGPLTPKSLFPGPFQQTEPAGSRSLPGHHKSIPSPEVSPTLGDAKFANTILRVYLPPQEDCVPLRLRSCMTISSFFESALGAFDIRDQIKKVAALRVTFEGKSDGRRNSQWTQLVKRGIPDSFEIFLDIVNGLPDLKGGESSQVKVEIMMKT